MAERLKTQVTDEIEPQIAEALAQANDLLEEAYAALCACVPPGLALAIATQVLEDLAVSDGVTSGLAH